MTKTIILDIANKEEDFFQQIIQQSQHRFMVFDSTEILDSKRLDRIEPQIAIVAQYVSDPGLGWGLANFLRQRYGVKLRIIILAPNRYQDYYCNDRAYKGKFNWIMHNRTVTTKQLLYELDRYENISSHSKPIYSPPFANVCNGVSNHQSSPTKSSCSRLDYSGPPHGWKNYADFIPGWNGKRLQDALCDRDYKTPSTFRQPYERMENTSSWFYVIDAAETIWVHSHYHHPDLVNGERVYGAGEMFVNCDTGEIVWINDTSGPYRPEGMMFYPYLNHLLQELGIHVSEVWQRAYCNIK